MYTKRCMKEASLMVRTTAKVLANGLMAAPISVSGQITSNMEQVGRRNQAVTSTKVALKKD